LLNSYWLHTVSEQRVFPNPKFSTKTWGARGRLDSVVLCTVYATPAESKVVCFEIKAKDQNYFSTRRRSLDPAHFRLLPIQHYPFSLISSTEISQDGPSSCSVLPLLQEQGEKHPLNLKFVRRFCPGLERWKSTRQNAPRANDELPALYEQTTMKTSELGSKWRS
jgi:hypothetical protein